MPPPFTRIAFLSFFVIYTGVDLPQENGIRICCVTLPDIITLPGNFLSLIQSHKKVSSLITASTMVKDSFSSSWMRRKIPTKECQRSRCHHLCMQGLALFFCLFHRSQLCLRTKANIQLFVVVVFHYQTPQPHAAIFFLLFIVRNSQFTEHCINYNEGLVIVLSNEK